MFPLFIQMEGEVHEAVPALGHQVWQGRTFPDELVLWEALGGTFTGDETATRYRAPSGGLDREEEEKEKDTIEMRSSYNWDLIYLGQCLL